MIQLSTHLASSGLIPSHLWNQPENITAVLLQASALDVPVWTAVQNLYPAGEEGQVGLRTRLLRSLMWRAGHDFRWVDSECDSTHAVAEITLRGETAPRRVSYEMAEAQQLGLTAPERDKDGHWTRQPHVMLRHRVASRTCDWHCPQVAAGLDLYAQAPPQGRIPALVMDGIGPEMQRAVTSADEAKAEPDRLRQVWRRHAGLLDQPARPDGTTLRQWLTYMIEEAVILEQRAREDLGGPQPSSEQQHVPTLMVCGCPKFEVIASGAHRMNCEEYVA
ncbi:hypothetical protein [Streptomyces sp. TR02-1]|uniref:hypothetical protein n=1 Tax=Streptomyces sp. TR02-1 TaxID=3385977 RepID=UPI0039A3AA7A